MANQWYVHRDAGPVGPLSDAELRRMAAHGEILPTALVSKDGRAWHAAESVRGLKFGVVAVARPAGDVSVAAAAKETKKTPVGCWWGIGLAVIYFGWVAYASIPTPSPSEVIAKVLGARSVTEVEGQITKRILPFLDRVTKSGGTIAQSWTSAQILEEAHLAPVHGGGCNILMDVQYKDDQGNTHAGLFLFRMVKPFRWGRQRWLVDDVSLIRIDGRPIEPPRSMGEWRGP